MTRGGCRGDEPVIWSDTATCRAIPTSCGRGDLALALNATAIPRCGMNHAALRHFNRSSTRTCFDRLALARRSSNADRRSHAEGRFRLLLVGVSNCFHVWHALVQDDMLVFDPMPNLRNRHPGCLNGAPDAYLKSYHPHHVHYSVLQVFTPNASIKHKTMASCMGVRAIGGGRLKHLTQTLRPYDVVAIHGGSWDAAYVSPRNGAALEETWDRDIAVMLAAWPETRLVLMTATPCGGTKKMARSSTNGRWTEAVESKLGRFTSADACEWMSSEFNGIVRRLAKKYTPRALLLDAHQMTTSRPGTDVFGYPPGIWMEQKAGLHFAGTETRAARDHHRARNPPSAAGEMTRALANRLLDMICPTDIP